MTLTLPARLAIHGQPQLNMLALISFGIGAAYLYSLVATFATGLFPPQFQTMGGMVPVYFEAASVITVLVLEIAALAMSLSSVSVIANALRLRKVSL